MRSSAIATLQPVEANVIHSDYGNHSTVIGPPGRRIDYGDSPRSPCFRANRAFRSRASSLRPSPSVT